MKKLVLLICAVLMSGSSLFAQVEMPPSNKPDAELTKKEAVLRIQDFQSRVSALEVKLNELNGKLATIQQELKNTNQALIDCRKEINSMVGATDKDIEAFAQKLGVLEGKVRAMKGLSDDQLADKTDEIKALEAEWTSLKENKIAIMPQFFNRMVQLGKDIKGLYREKKVTTYTVGTWAEDKDCLWNISGKMEIYGDPFQWPKIWQANTDKVRNPDIIFPGQVLTLPVKGPKTDDEMKAERKYWRNKRAAEAAATTPATPGN